MAISRASIIYGWDLSHEENLPVDLDNNDGSKKFKKARNKLWRTLSEADYFHNFEYFKNGGDFDDGDEENEDEDLLNQCAFGIRLTQMSTFMNIEVSDLTLVPSKEQKQELKDALKDLDPHERKFFKAAGKPKVFIIWHND